jgi:leucyl/phenylalanyl-tRNA--protein transferase
MMKLTPELLLKAYSIGIFPMAESRNDPELHWIDPEERGILPLDRLHVPRRLKRRIRQGAFDVRCNTAFDEVIHACAKPAKNRPDTWINPAIEHLVMELHAMGFAHSIECWRDDRLLGGLYGVSLGGCFFGESMFSREKDASKIALVHLVFRMRKGGFVLLDTQFTTPHLTQFGVIDISRADYRELLGKAINLPAEFPLAPFSMAEIADYLDMTA